MNQITHIFFDLDHTLWDYNANAKKVLHEMYEVFQISKGTKKSAEAFSGSFFEINDKLWYKYHQGVISKNEIREERFSLVLRKIGFEGEISIADLSDYFLFHCPRQGMIIEAADIVSDYLSKRYHLSIVTNGFDDVQSIKLKFSGLEKYFSKIFTSETTGFKKPSRQIFDHAIEMVQADRDKVLMIGDNPQTDIKGALNAGITPVFFNPTGRKKSVCQLQINHLTELLRLF